MEFEQDPYGLQDFHEAQLKHYGLKRETAVAIPTRVSSLQQNFQRNEATGMPVPNGRPKRKPVHGPNQTSTSLASPSRTQPPRAQSPHPMSPKTQGPEGTKLIFTSADGRFDPSTIRTESRGYTPPASPIEPNRPTSRSSSKPSLKRTNSNSSKSSWRSRRDSAEHVVRKISSSLKEKAEIVAMDRNERVMFVRNKQIAPERPGSPVKARPGRSGSITKGEKLALNISKAVDSLKARGRSGSNDSAMSIRMTDTAPEGELQACLRCYRPIFDFATNGLCQQCHKDTSRDVDPAFVDPWQFPQGRHTYPESLEHGYIKLPNRKILRIRQTIYHDPGNPFADEADPEGIGGESSGIEKTLPGDAFLTGSQVQGGPAIAHRTDQVSLVKNSAMTSIKQSQHRSKSAVLTSSVWNEFEEGYTPPRTFWRKESAPSGPHLQNGNDITRDTKFYDFYDDIL